MNPSATCSPLPSPTPYGRVPYDRPCARGGVVLQVCGVTRARDGQHVGRPVEQVGDCRLSRCRCPVERLRGRGEGACGQGRVRHERDAVVLAVGKCVIVALVEVVAVLHGRDRRDGSGGGVLFGGDFGQAGGGGFARLWGGCTGGRGGGAREELVLFAPVVTVA